MFVVTIYYRERIQVKISQRKRQWATFGEGSHPQSAPCPEDSLLPWHRYVVVHTQYCHPGKLTPPQPQCPDFVLRLQGIGMIGWFIDYPYDWTHLQVHWPKAPTRIKSWVFLAWPAPTLQLLGVARPTPKSSSQTKTLLSAVAQITSQTPLSKAKFFTTQSVSCSCK